MLGEVLGNVLMFVPLGMALALVPSSTVRAWLRAAAIAFPFLIEVTQLPVPALDRACGSGDVIDSLLGLGIGLLLGRATGWTAHLIAGSRAGSGHHRAR